MDADNINDLDTNKTTDNDQFTQESDNTSTDKNIPLLRFQEKSNQKSISLKSGKSCDHKINPERDNHTANISLTECDNCEESISMEADMVNNGEIGDRPSLSSAITDDNISNSPEEQTSGDMKTISYNEILSLAPKSTTNIEREDSHSVLSYTENVFDNTEEALAAEVNRNKRIVIHSRLHGTSSDETSELNKEHSMQQGETKILNDRCQDYTNRATEIKDRKCPGCSKTLTTNKQQFKEHIQACFVNKSKSHDLEKIVVNSIILLEWNSNHKCPYCDQTFGNFEDWKSHNTLEHGYHYKIYSCPLNYRCPGCMKMFRRRMDVYDHILSQVDINKCKFSSLHSPKELFFNRLLEGHAFGMTRWRGNKIIKNVESEQVKEVNDVDKCDLVKEFFKPGFQCKECPYSIHRRLSYAELHIQNCHSLNSPKQVDRPPEKLSLCDICGCSVKSRKMSVHLYKQHGIDSGVKKKTCPVCQKIFINGKGYKEHLLGHKQSVRIKCKECGKSFSKKNLRSHQKSHEEKKSGEKFHCVICDRYFYTSQSFKIHKIYHKKSLEQEFKCEICGKAFALKHHLKSHQLVHTKVRNFTCDKCGYAFTLKHHLEFHMKRKHPSNSKCE